MDNIDFIQGLAEKVFKESSGRVLYVGGYVRDLVMGNKRDDIDLLVFNLTKEEFYDKFSEYAQQLSEITWNTMHLFKLEDLDILFSNEIFVPHNSVSLNELEPFLAMDLRDLTINNMYLDVLDNTLLDFQGGQSDIEAKIIRPSNLDYFKSNTINYFRAISFASRFNFNLHPEIVTACKAVDENTILPHPNLISDTISKGLLIDPKKMYKNLIQTGLAPLLLPSLSLYTSKEHLSIENKLGIAMEYKDYFTNYQALIYTIFADNYFEVEGCLFEQDFSSEMFKYQKHTKKYAKLLLENKDKFRDIDLLQDEDLINLICRLTVVSLKEMLAYSIIQGNLEVAAKLDSYYNLFVKVKKKNRHLIMSVVSKNTFIKLGLSKDTPRKVFQKLRDEMLLIQLEDTSYEDLLLIAKQKVDAILVGT